MNDWHPWQLKKKSKFWWPFWSYQVNSTANSAYSPRKWANKLVVLFSWQLQNGPQDFDFFSIAIGANYSLKLISIETYAPQFIGYNKFFLDSVSMPILPILICNSPVINLFLTTGGLHSKPTKFTEFTNINSYKFAFDPGNVRCINYNSKHRTSPTSLTSS